jgi:branched-chain amino acid transport system ATP-binding protein
MLKIDSIETSYGLSQVLYGLSLEVKEGQVVTLMGRNGMGKTTTVRSIMGQAVVNAGSITFDGINITGMDDFKIAQLGIGLVPEGRQVFPNLTVRENLIATADNRSALSEPWTLDSVLDLLPALIARQDAMGNQLSGGEQQMLAIGRALMTNPKMVILDEATEGLAPLIRKEIWQCLEGLRGRGQSIMVIDKNVEALTRIGDHHYIIERGRVVWEGDSNNLNSDEEIKHRYLGV